jgi:hypothetical protein
MSPTQSADGAGGGKRGWFWAKVGLDFSKRRIIVEGGSSIKISDESWIFLLLGKLVLVQGQFGQEGVCVEEVGV